MQSLAGQSIFCTTENRELNYPTNVDQNGETYHLEFPKVPKSWLFILMINDLEICGASKWKFVDDTTTAEIVSKDSTSFVQDAVTDVQEWSMANRLTLNA